MKVNFNVSNVSSFKGLWGDCETKKSTYKNMDPAIYSKEFNVYDINKPYFPFIDETEKEVNEIKRRNTVSYKNFNHDTFVYTSKVNSKCEVCDVLPITKQEFKDYKANKLDNMTSADIEDTLQVFGLEKYINKD